MLTSVIVWEGETKPDSSGREREKGSSPQEEGWGVIHGDTPQSLHCPMDKELSGPQYRLEEPWPGLFSSHCL